MGSRPIPHMTFETPAAPAFLPVPGILLPSLPVLGLDSTPQFFPWGLSRRKPSLTTCAGQGAPAGTRHQSPVCARPGCPLLSGRSPRAPAQLPTASLQLYRGCGQTLQCPLLSPLPEGPDLDVVLPSQLSAQPTLLVLGLQAGCPPGPLPHPWSHPSTPSDPHTLPSPHVCVADSAQGPQPPALRPREPHPPPV